jgi:agmatinase
MDVIQRGKIPILIGGEHTITIGAVRAFHQDVVVIDLDAHSDLRDTYQGDSFCHATVMRRILEQGKEIIELGVRSMSLEEFQFVNDHTIKIFYRHDIREKGLAAILKDLQHLITGKKIYLSIDVDVFDPSEAPGVSTPEPDGLSFSEVNRIIRTVCTSGDVVGVDAVEVTPIPGNETTEFLTAKMLYEILGYI